MQSFNTHACFPPNKQVFVYKLCMCSTQGEGYRSTDACVQQLCLKKCMQYSYNQKYFSNRTSCMHACNKVKIVYQYIDQAKSREVRAHTFGYNGNEWTKRLLRGQQNILFQH